MSDVEIRRRIIPPLPRDLADDYRPPYLRAAEREVLDSPAMNAPNHRGAEMLSTEATVNLRKLEERITRNTIDEIATLIQSLTYGEMIELAETMWNVRPEGSAITQDSLPALLYRWSKSDLAAANIAKPPALLQRNDLRQDQDAKNPGISAGAVVGRVAD
jgi:hypothetical protein